jgi:DNA-binding LytR/AlgR family response regulator
MLRLYVDILVDMTLSAVIVDDEQLARDELSYLLKSVDDVNIVAQGRNGLEAVNLIKEHAPDLVFLDVQMPGLDGFGVIKKLVDKKVSLPQIIFATAYDQYAVKAFEVNAIDYLLKPFDKKRVSQAIEKVRRRLQTAAAAGTEKLDTLVKMLEAQRPQNSKVLLRPSRNCWAAWMRKCSGAPTALSSSTSTASRKWCPGSKAPINSAWTIRSKPRFRSAGLKPKG